MEPAACSNLVPVRSGSLIPDYGSLGLGHADAQLCAHLQVTDLNLALRTGRRRLLASGTPGFRPKRVSARHLQSTPALWLRLLSYKGVVKFSRRCCLLSAVCLVTPGKGKRIKADYPPLQGDKSPRRRRLHDRLKAAMAPKSAKTNEKRHAAADLSVISQSLR